MRITRNRVHTRLLVLLAGMAFVSSLPASAQTRAENRLDRTEARETRQGTRIDKGVTAGAIATNEAARLQGQQTRIATRSDRLASDGFYSRRDHARISAQQRRSSRNIAFARVNRR